MTLTAGVQMARKLRSRASSRLKALVHATQAPQWLSTKTAKLLDQSVADALKALS
jgi:hypothetical protein